MGDDAAQTNAEVVCVGCEAVSFCERGVVGFEYNFKVSEEDLKTLARHPDGVDNLPAILRSGPGFLGEAESIYSYGGSDQQDWRPSVALHANGFYLCIYDRSPDSPDMKLVDYLIHELLHRCGRVEVEEG